MKQLCVLLAIIGFSVNLFAKDVNKTFQKTCGVCHVPGVAGAPKVGDKAAWEPRLAKGMQTMVDSVAKGKGAMPPKGLCADCSQDDYRALIEHMIVQ